MANFQMNLSAKLSQLVWASWPQGNQSFASLTPLRGGEKELVFVPWEGHGSEEIHVPLPKGEEVVSPPSVSWAHATGGNADDGDFQEAVSPTQVEWVVGLKSEFVAEMRRVRDELNTLLGE